MSIAQLLEDQFPIRIPGTAATLSGFRAWVTSDDFPERWRASFIEGEVLLEMSPEESETHTKVKWEIGRVLLTLTRRLKNGTYYGDGVLLTNKEAQLSTQPDGMFVTRQAIRSGRLRRVPRRDIPNQFTEFEGTPDLVVEVISRTSRKQDTDDLPALFHLAGIPEYWLIDALGDDVEFSILRRGARQFIAVEPVRGWSSSEVMGRKFKLVRARDEDGDWQYELKVKK
jgi:Uma2 family endonuclease